MAENFIETFFTSNDEQRTSMYPQLFSSLKEDGFRSVGNIVELSVEDCVLEKNLADVALNFLNTLLDDDEVTNDMAIRKAVLDGAQKALNSEITHAIFIREKQPEWRIDNILRVWRDLFRALLKGRSFKEHRVVLNTLCPPLRQALVSTNQYVAQLALSVWRSLTETLFDSITNSSKAVCSEANLIVVLEFLLKPLKYHPDSYTTMKFEIWLQLAIAISQYSSTLTSFELVIMGLMRMSIGGSLKTVEPQSVQDSLICEPMSSDSVMVVEKCIWRCAQEWMEQKMSRHECLAEKGVLLIAALLGVDIPNNSLSLKSLSSAQMHFIPSLLISACIRVYSFYLTKDAEALTRVHLQLENLWAALIGTVLLKQCDTTQRTSHLRNVISSYIAWIDECQLPIESITRSYFLLCSRAHFLNLSLGFTISDVFVALFRKVSFNVNSTLLRQISELAIAKLMGCRNVIRLNLFRCIVFGCLPQSPAENHSCNAIPVLWDALANALIIYITETEEVNEGTSTNVDYGTVDRMLLCPVSAYCCSANFFRIYSTTQFCTKWKELYSSVHTIYAREMNSNCFSYALKTFHKLIQISAQIQLIPDENHRRESCVMVSHILEVVVEKFPFSALGESIFEAGTDDPIEVLCKAISVFGDSLLNVIDSKDWEGVNASELDNDCVSIGNLLATLKFVFSALTSTLYHVTVITNLAPFLAHLIDSRLDVLFKRSRVSFKVHNLLKTSFKSIKEHYSGPYCSEMLSKFEPLFISALGCSNYSIRYCIVSFWRETFANTSQLQSSSQMREALMSVKSRQRLALPIVSTDNNTFSCNNQDSTVSSFNETLHNNNNSSDNLSQSQENVPTATPLTPIRHDENAQQQHRKIPVRSSTRRKRYIDAINDESQFEVIEPQTPTRKMRLTERQREKLNEKRELMAFMSDDVSQTNSRPLTTSALASAYLIESSQSASSLSSITNSQQNPSSQFQSTQPINGIDDGADEERKDGFMNSEVMEETPPRQPAQSPNKTTQRLCRNADIRNYLSPSGAIHKSPQKDVSVDKPLQECSSSSSPTTKYTSNAKTKRSSINEQPSASSSNSANKNNGTSPSSNAPKRRCSTRLRTKSLKKREADDDDDERQELVDSIEVFSQSDHPPSQEQQRECSSAEPDLNLLITDIDDGDDACAVGNTDENEMGVVSPAEHILFGTLEEESPEPAYNNDITTPPNIANNQSVAEAPQSTVSTPQSQQSVIVISPEAVPTDSTEKANEIQETKHESVTTPSILKKSRSSDTESPFTTSEKKVRRVHFDVSQIDGQSETETTRSNSKKRFRRRPATSLFHTAQEKASSQQLSSNVSSPSPSRSLSLPTNDTACTKTAIFPALTNCSDTIPPQMFFKLGGPCGFEVRNAFKALGISTIGDLARLNEDETHLLSIRKPQSNTIRSALQDYFTSSSQINAISNSKITDDSTSRTTFVKEIDDIDGRKPFRLSAETLKMVEPIVYGESSKAPGDCNACDQPSSADGTESSSESAEGASAEILSSQEDSQQQTHDILSDFVKLNTENVHSILSKAIQSTEDDDISNDDIQLINIEEVEGVFSKEHSVHEGNEQPIENDSNENAQLRTQSPPASDSPKSSTEQQQSKSLLLTALRNRIEGDTEIQVSLDDNGIFLSSYEEGVNQVDGTNVKVDNEENNLRRDDKIAKKEDEQGDGESLKSDNDKCIERATKIHQSEEISREILPAQQHSPSAISSANANLNQIIINEPIQTSDDTGDDANSVIRENTYQTVANQQATTSGQQDSLSKQRDVWNEAWQAIEQLSALIERSSDPSTSTNPSEQLFAINKKLSLACTLLLAKRDECDSLLFNVYNPQQ